MPVVEEREQADLKSRVLLVDDEPVVRKGLSRLLRTAGCEVLEAADGREAIEQAKEVSFDVVVSDVQMPDLSGVELLQALHAVDPELSVVLISGAPDLETAMKAVEYGAIEYLTKPLDVEKLSNSVARAAKVCRDKREAKNALQLVRSGSRAKSQRRGMLESWTGELLAGRYRVGEKIGSGGMGSVYEAVREDLGGMSIAIKIVHSVLGADEDLFRRFCREARTLASLDHPNIVRVVDFQTPEDEPAILVLERLHGCSLATVIEQQAQLPVERVAFIGHQTLAGLAAAHEKNIVHRDLKPENIFLTSVAGVDDIVRLLDFGVAKVFDQELDAHLTRTGAVIGTPAYMAPEQARGGKVDARSDIYGVGCILYEALTGCPPFRADNYNALLVAIQEGEPVSIFERRPDVPAEFVDVVTRAMAKDVADRFQSADEMREALAPWLPVRTSSSEVPAESLRAFAPTGVFDPHATAHESPGAKAKSRKDG